MPGVPTDVHGASDRPRARQAGIHVGLLPLGPLNAITDVDGVRVGHCTLWRAEDVRTGVTVICPRPGDIFQQQVPGAVHVGNGFGKLAGATQVQELGRIETPIVLTNTLSVATAVQALVRHTLSQPGNEQARSVNALVGETNDGYLNDIRGLHVREEDVLQALAAAQGGPVAEGAVGAGTGTVCFGYKGGIGTASRRLPADLGGYTVGVLVQTNYGGVLTINGAPVGRELGRFAFSDRTRPAADGSCMIVVATDAPLSARNLERLARRAPFGLARTGSCMDNGSGDYAIAFSTAADGSGSPGLEPPRALLTNAAMSPLFLAVVEATEEAVYNSLFRATAVTGHAGHSVDAMPLDRVLEICRQYRVLNLQDRLPGIR